MKKHIARGFEFEDVALRVLTRYFGFELAKSKLNVLGGGDYGLDLVGVWPLLLSSSLDGQSAGVGVQCKSLSSQIPVPTIRELESSVRRMEAKMGIIASTTLLSVAARDWFLKSDLALVSVLVDQPHELPNSFAMNPAAKAQLHPSIQVRRQPSLGGGPPYDLLLVKRPSLLAQPPPKHVVFF
ncbi:hypothetical protein BASA81_008829 [Batrachochytrium salamandrivorans]|nr:hypothetical protein BASA81_008829 [Batrachochytrium salamandrivorans]